MKDGLTTDRHGTKQWYLNGVHYTEDKYNKERRKNKLEQLDL